jgi:hypothetical protein
MFTYYALAIPELLEIIFAFLSRKDLYRSCTRVNRQWNSVSMRVIREKRKNEFINIPHIQDNIILHLFNDHCESNEFKKYCNVNKLWRNILLHLRIKVFHFIDLSEYDVSVSSAQKIGRKRLLREKRQLNGFMVNRVHQCLKHDPELNRYYQDILSKYNIRCEFLRLSKIFQSSVYNTQDEFRKMSRAFRFINR